MSCPEKESCVSFFNASFTACQKRYVPAEAAEDSPVVPFGWPEGDATLIQIDMASLQPEATGYETMSAYKYLLKLEKLKKITKYELSYTEAKRCPVENGEDKFEMSVKNAHVYRCLPEKAKQPSCKGFFADLATSVKDGAAAMTVFRFRFDRVHAVSKVQKPYVFTRVALELEPGKPVQL